MERIEKRRAAAGKFLTSVLVPLYRGPLDVPIIIGDLIEPLIETYNQREGTFFDITDLWHPVEDRRIDVIGSRKIRGDDIGWTDSLGLRLYDYDFIQNVLKQLWSEHARAEEGAERWDIPSGASRAKELASEAREIEQKIESLKERGREELETRRTRRDDWLQKNGFSSSEELLQKLLLDGTIGQKK